MNGISLTTQLNGQDYLIWWQPPWLLPSVGRTKEFERVSQLEIVQPACSALTRREDAPLSHLSMSHANIIV